jgi:hypothetical protein
MSKMDFSLLENEKALSVENSYTRSLYHLLTLLTVHTNVERNRKRETTRKSGFVTKKGVEKWDATQKY